MTHEITKVQRTVISPTFGRPHTSIPPVIVAKSRDDDALMETIQVFIHFPTIKNPGTRIPGFFIFKSYRIVLNYWEAKELAVDSWQWKAVGSNHPLFPFRHSG